MKPNKAVLNAVGLASSKGITPQFLIALRVNDDDALTSAYCLGDEHIKETSFPRPGHACNQSVTVGVCKKLPKVGFFRFHSVQPAHSEIVGTATVGNKCGVVVGLCNLKGRLRMAIFPYETSADVLLVLMARVVGFLLHVLHSCERERVAFQKFDSSPDAISTHCTPSPGCGAKSSHPQKGSRGHWRRD